MDNFEIELINDWSIIYNNITYNVNWNVEPNEYYWLNNFNKESEFLNYHIVKIDNIWRLVYIMMKTLMNVAKLHNINFSESDYPNYNICA